MKMTAHKQTTAGQAASAAIDPSVGKHDLSVSQAISQALADSTKPSTGQSAAESHLPKVDIPGLGEIPLRLGGHSPDDPAKGDTHGFSLDAISLDKFATPVAALREGLLASLHTDPIARNDANDWLPGGRTSSADLRAQAGLPDSSSDAGAKHQAAAVTLFEHGQDSREKADGMLGKVISDYNDGFGEERLREDGEWHVLHATASDQGITIIRDWIRTDGGKGGSLYSTTTVDSTNHTATVVYADGSTVTSKGGKVVDTTPALEQQSSTPDWDRPSTLPPLADLLKNLDLAQHPSHDGTATNSAGDEIPGTVAVNTAGPFVDHAVHDSPVDPGNPAKGIGDQGRPDGSPGAVGPNSGNGNLIHDIDQGTQSDGRNERDPQPEIKHDAPSAANSDAVQGSAADQNGSHLVALTGKLAETAAQHAAERLRDAVAQHDGPDQNVASKNATDKAGDLHVAHELAHGVHLVDDNHFGEFVKAAQTLMQSELLSAVLPVSEPHPWADGAEIGSQDLSAHGGEHLRAVAAIHDTPLVTLHDNDIDHPTAALTVTHVWHQ